MAKLEDYLPGGPMDPQRRKEGSLEGEIEGAAQAQLERERDPETGQFRSTQDGAIDWEKRYKELEQHNSRQAQELGTLRKDVNQYRTAFDEYLLKTPLTTEEAKSSTVENYKVTSDDLWEKPDEAINKAIDSHPAIREAREAAERAQRQAILDAKAEFERAHPNYQETLTQPSFAEWVRGNSTRLSLAQRADQWDFNAADALFTLYEAEQQLNGIQNTTRQARAVEIAELESAGIGEPPPDAKYSRTEMREVMIAARQGDMKAQRYLDTHLPKYRAALASGQVTD